MKKSEIMSSDNKKKATISDKKQSHNYPNHFRSERNSQILSKKNFSIYKENALTDQKRMPDSETKSKEGLSACKSPISFKKNLYYNQPKTMYLYNLLIVIASETRFI